MGEPVTEERETRLCAIDERRDDRSLDRLVNFSDAVFAIAITLLALDVRLSGVDGTVLRPPLGSQIIELLPNLFAFALSFVVIGGYWVAHHRMFKYVERYDTRLLWINLVVLFFIGLLPFPTQVVAEYGDTTLGIQIYAGAMTLTGLAVLGLILYAEHAKLIVHPGTIKRTLIKSSITPAIFGTSMIVAFWSPAIAAMLWWLVALAFFVVDPLINSKWDRLLGKPDGQD